MKKSFETPLDFIIRVTKELGTIKLSSKCGNHESLIYNGQDVLVKSFAGKFGYSLTDVKHLNKKTIDIIYDDVKEDFS